jgi:hypothetical protein
MKRMVLDAGALIALEREDRTMWARLAGAQRRAVPLVTHAGVLAQVWRRPARQARLVRALRAVDVRPLDPPLGRLAGQLLAESTSDDIVDAALVALCGPEDAIYTSDPDDILELAGRANVEIDVIRV